MSFNVQLNADRFAGFADIYNAVRPKMPAFVPETITKYLGKPPRTVVDLGCGTGLSAFAWQGIAEKVIGVEPGEGMLAEARKNAPENVEFVQAFGFDTGLPDETADAVVCSQSFHWMEPEPTLREIYRVLKPGGVFAAVDNDWPPVCCCRAELAYQKLFKLVGELEKTSEEIKGSFHRWSKEKHLENIQKSGLFAFSREIVFSGRESCDAERFIGLAMSQGSVQKILRVCPGRIAGELAAFEEAVRAAFGGKALPADFCYRMRTGVKAG